MTVNAIPMAKQTKEEVIENDLGKTLKSSKITSEIDFLKRMKLKQQISVAATTSGDTSLKAIADFQSADDKRIQEVYSKLIAMYQAAEDEKKAAVLTPSTSREKRNILANLYATFGYRDLYEIASVISEIRRVQNENLDIMSSVNTI